MTFVLGDTQMATHYYQFLITAPGLWGPARKQRYATTDDVKVRDLSTQNILKIKAGDVSPYHHSLLLDGRPFQILNILK